MNKIVKKILSLGPVKLVAICLTVIAIGGSTIYAMTGSGSSKVSENATSSKKIHTASPSVSPLPSPSSAAATVAPSSTSQPSQTPTPSTKSTTKPKSNDPPQETIRVIGIIANGSSYCDVGSTNYRVGLNYAYVSTNTYPGVIMWQIEARQFGNVNIIASGSGTMAMYQGTYEIKSPHDYYVGVQPQANTALRVHVTSPTDMVSQWFSADSMSAGSPCATQ